MSWSRSKRHVLKVSIAFSNAGVVVVLSLKEHVKEGIVVGIAIALLMVIYFLVL